jgi:site-specific recombinase XerD
VTHLRQIMLEELRRRNFADSTIRSYLHAVEHFSRYFHRRPDQLGPEHIRQYQAMLFTKLKFSPNTVTPRLAALRFFYVQVLTAFASTHLRHPHAGSRRRLATRRFDRAQREIAIHRLRQLVVTSSRC